MNITCSLYPSIFPSGWRGENYEKHVAGWLTSATANYMIWKYLQQYQSSWH